MRARARAAPRVYVLCISGHQRFSVCGFSDSLNVKFAGECAVKGEGDQPGRGGGAGGGGGAAGMGGREEIGELCAHGAAERRPGMCM